MVPVWMTYNPRFKITIIQRQITRKWYNIELYVRRPTNRKSYMIYQTAPSLMTLNDPYFRFQGHSILWRSVSQKWYEVQFQCEWNTIIRTYTRPTGTRIVARSLRQLSFLLSVTEHITWTNIFIARIEKDEMAETKDR